MKRLVLAIAASVLASGCEPCTRDVTLEWDSHFEVWPVGTQASYVTGCDGAGVSSVDVWVNDVYAATFDCHAGGATITDVGDGSNLFTVEGMGPTGLLLYRDEVTVGSACGNQLVSVSPAEGHADLNYSAWPACEGTADCFVWFSLRDDIAYNRGDTLYQTAAVVDGATFPQSYPYPSDVVFRLPIGNYSLDWFQLVTPPPYTEVAKVCGNPAFSIAAGQTTSASLPLYATGATCP